jgi:acetylornithine deacetylase
MDIATRAQAAAAALGDGPIALLRDLIAAQRDGEAAIQSKFAAFCEASGAEIVRHRYRPADVSPREEFAAGQVIASDPREAVVARVKGSGGGRGMLLFAHPDGEPFVADHGWRHDPFAGEIADGRLHGWGVADDLAGVATMAAALRALAQAGLRPKGDVILCSTPSKRHARGVHALLQAGYRADAAVYLHPAESGAGMREVKTLAPGQLVFRVTVEGRAPDTNEPDHTAFAHKAVDPLDKAILVRRALMALDARRGSAIVHKTLDAAIGRSTNLLIGDFRTMGDGRASRVPPEVRMTAALSFPPGETLADVQAQVRAAIDSARVEDAYLRDHPPVVEFLSGVTGAEVPEGHALRQAVDAAVRAATGAAPHANPLHTSSDIRNPMVQSGIPCVGLGPLCGDLTQNGLRDEWVDVADYRRGVGVIAAAIALWCGVAA